MGVQVGLETGAQPRKLEEQFEGTVRTVPSTVFSGVQRVLIEARLLAALGASHSARRVDPRSAPA